MRVFLKIETLSSIWDWMIFVFAYFMGFFMLCYFVGLIYFSFRYIFGLMSKDEKIMFKQHLKFCSRHNDFGGGGS